MRPTTVTSAFRRHLTTTPFRRYASSASSPSTSSTTSAASSAASNAVQQVSTMTAKAGETIQNLSAKVGPAAMNTLAAVGKLGGRTGKLVKRIEAAIPPTMQNLRIARELAKLVFQARQMQPPSVSTFETEFHKIYQFLLHPRIPPLSTIRERLTDTAALKNGAIITAEVLGFFTLGEMIGRRKIVGYRGKVDSHGHH